MGDAVVTAQQAKAKAAMDYQEGGTQDDNPYDKNSQLEAHRAYQWEMHKLWSDMFGGQYAN